MKQLRKLSFLMMAMFAALTTLSLTSCGDDDDEPKYISDYNIVCGIACDGGYTAAEIEAMEQLINTSAAQSGGLENVSEAEAIKVFDTFISRIKTQFASGDPTLGSHTMVMTFRLVSYGETVRSATVTITGTSCY